MKYIRDKNSGEVGEVVDMLSSQFIVDINGQLRFYFYCDKNVEWEVANARKRLQDTPRQS